jgi:hypothetical protein
MCPLSLGMSWPSKALTTSTLGGPVVELVLLSLFRSVSMVSESGLEVGDLPPESVVLGGGGVDADDIECWFSL